MIAVGLMAALSYSISREGTGSQQNQLTEAKAELLASEIIAHANAAAMAVQKLNQWGVDYDEIQYDAPPGNNTNASRQLFHPSGGGLEYVEYDASFFEGTQSRGWRVQNETNIEWSPTPTGTDFIYTLIDLKGEICEKINAQLTGSAIMPATDANFGEVFNGASATDSNFVRSECADCENYKSICIRHSGNGKHAFYNILGMR